MVERTAPAELRAQGRNLSGVAIRYGEHGSVRAERFSPGAFTSRESPLTLDAFHDPAWPVAVEPQLEVIDGPEALTVAAELRSVAPGLPGSAPLALIRDRTLRGLSVAFTAKRERLVDGVRVIDEAHLHGIGAVPQPEYAGSRIELRQGGGWLTASVPLNMTLQCECQGPDCDSVSFDAGAFSELIDGPDEVLAVAGDFSKPLGSKQRGTLLMEETDDGLQIELTTQSPAGREVSEAAAVAPVYVRPLIDVDASTWRMVGGTRVFSNVVAAALLVKATTNADGWLPAIIAGAIAQALTTRNRTWL